MRKRALGYRLETMEHKGCYILGRWPMWVRSSASRQTNEQHNSNLHSLPREFGPAALNRLIRLMYPAFLHSHIYHKNTSNTHLQSRNCRPLGTRSKCAQVPKRHPFYYQEARALRRLLIKGTTFGCAILYSHLLLAVNIVACLYKKVLCSKLHWHVQGYSNEGFWQNRNEQNQMTNVQNIPVMQTRLLALPELKKIWCQSVATPVIRFWDEATAEQENGNRVKRRSKNSGFSS